MLPADPAWRCKAYLPTTAIPSDGSGGRHFSIKLQTQSSVMRGPADAGAGSTARMTWIGRVDPVEPGHDDLCLSM
jgi:hypothetical protein